MYDKKLRMVTTVILVLATAFICCACGEKQGNPIRLPDDKATGSGEPVAGGAVSDMPEVNNNSFGETEQTQQAIEEIQSVEENTMYDRIPMLKVKGKLYYDTGKVYDGARCGVMDGEITSSVDGSEIPTEDDQSNFGSGFGYQCGEDDTIIVYMNEKWAIFEYRGESE